MGIITPPPHPLASARWQGLRVGLLGGSFNPAHAGHMHIARQALVRFKLHAIWWVVTPGNPLKVKNPSGDLQHRLEGVERFIGRQPRMVATDIEARLGTRYTYETLKALRRRFPRTAFIWIAGMDNACAFERWDRWEDLPGLAPFVFFDRPPSTSKVKGKKLRNNKRIQQNAHTLVHRVSTRETGVYWMLSGRAINLSSTTLRAHKDIML